MATAMWGSPPGRRTRSRRRCGRRWTRRGEAPGGGAQARARQAEGEARGAGKAVGAGQAVSEAGALGDRPRRDLSSHARGTRPSTSPGGGGRSRQSVSPGDAYQGAAPGGREDGGGVMAKQETAPVELGNLGKPKGTSTQPKRKGR